MKIIAWYLPQFHEFKENNEWWGKGFTEWTCLERAKSFFEGHIIKHPHKDIGYYSLLNKETRINQAILAKKYGIYGFCYYHYWFGGKLLMESILHLMLKDGEPDLPFCLSWANEPWTRRMNGGDGSLLQGAFYGGIEEWELHLQYLLKFFTNKNYILIDNKPLFVIYRVSQIKNYTKRFRYWNKRIKDYGFNGIFLVLTLGNFPDNYSDIIKHVNAAVEFFPNFLNKSELGIKTIGNVIYYDLPFIYNYILKFPQIHKRQFHGTFPGFDSSPRSGLRSNVFLNGSPDLFCKHLKKQILRSKDFIFINAWNEWGEGAVLEPSEQYNYDYLEATKEALAIKFFI